MAQCRGSEPHTEPSFAAYEAPTKLVMDTRGAHGREERSVLALLSAMGNCNTPEGCEIMGTGSLDRPITCGSSDSEHTCTAVELVTPHRPQAANLAHMKPRTDEKLHAWTKC